MSDTPRAWKPTLFEVAICLGTAALYLASCLLIKVSPLRRMGQISGLASLGLRFVLVTIVLVVVLVIAARVRGGRRFELTSRLVCAALAGISSAFVAGGLIVALRGTPFGINGLGGDIGFIASWASGLQHGEPIPPMYPPLSIHTLRLYADMMGIPPAFAVKDLQILGTAAFGPVAYLSWRLLFKPGWALAIGCVAMLPMIEPYKPYPNLVLVAFIPIALLFLDTLRKAAEYDGIQLARASIAFGAAFGLMCLFYSGWFQWSAPGLFIATLLVFPWRAGRRQALVLLLGTGLVFGLISFQYILALLSPAAKIRDAYVYFDVNVEPMYIAMWRNDTPGVVGTWPPHGELGGVGLYTILLACGLGLAIVLARKTTIVIGATAVLAGAWVMRFFYAKSMWDTKLVQLYPRTTPLILYCLLVLCGYAIYCALERIREDHPIRGPSGLIGVICALALVFASAGSSTASRYMPLDSEPVGAGWLTMNSHRLNRSLRLKTYVAYLTPWIRRAKDVP